jgi:hypothetical protein
MILKILDAIELGLSSLKSSKLRTRDFFSETSLAYISDSHLTLVDTCTQQIEHLRFADSNQTLCAFYVLNEQSCLLFTEDKTDACFLLHLIKLDLGKRSLDSKYCARLQPEGQIIDVDVSDDSTRLALLLKSSLCEYCASIYELEELRQIASAPLLASSFMNTISRFSFQMQANDRLVVFNSSLLSFYRLLPNAALAHEWKLVLTLNLNCHVQHVWFTPNELLLSDDSTILLIDVIQARIKANISFGADLQRMTQHDSCIVAAQKRSLSSKEKEKEEKAAWINRSIIEKDKVTIMNGSSFEMKSVDHVYEIENKIDNENENENENDYENENGYEDENKWHKQDLHSPIDEANRIKEMRKCERGFVCLLGENRLAVYLHVEQVKMALDEDRLLSSPTPCTSRFKLACVASMKSSLHNEISSNLAKCQINYTSSILFSFIFIRLIFSLFLFFFLYLFYIFISIYFFNFSLLYVLIFIVMSINTK